MPSPDTAPLHGQDALRRIVRLAARTFGADAAQFVPEDRRSDVVAYGSTADLRGLGLAALVREERGLVVADTTGTPPFSRLAPAVRFVAAVPVTGQERLGVLCLLDGRPRALEPAEQQALAEFGYLAAAVVEGGHAVMRAARSLFDGHGALMLLIDPRSGKIVEANAAAAAFYGSTVEELAGRPLAALSSLSEDRMLSALRGALQEARSLLRLRHRDAAGEASTVELMVSTVVIGGRLLLYAIGRDVTDEQRAAEHLRRQERTLRAFYDQAPTMMGVVELAGDDVVYLSSNEAAARFYGTTPEAMAGRAASELRLPDAIRTRWVEAFRTSALTGEAVDFACEHPHPRGHRHLDVVVKCIGLSPEGAPQFSFIAADVTERAQVGAALRAVQGRSEVAARQAGDLLTSLDHEIRAPLAGLVEFSEALDEAVAAEHRDVSGLIVRTGRRLLNTIDSVLALAQLEWSQAEVERVRVDVVAEVEAAVRLLQPLAARKGLRVEVRAADVAPIWTDAVLLGRLVHALVGNALAFTEEGGVLVEVAAEEAGVVLRVRDTGAGVNDAFLPRHADAVGSGAEPGEPGTLGIARRLVELLGGTLDAASQRGAGTTFRVRLPRHAEPEAEAVEEGRARDEPPAREEAFRA
jgi:PAS domain S-box-containing protein